MGAGAARNVQPASELVPLASAVTALPHQVVDHPLESLQAAELILGLGLSRGGDGMAFQTEHRLCDGWYVQITYFILNTQMR